MENSGKRIFVTGIAGFIGFHLAKALRSRGDLVLGVDHFSSYYDPSLKQLRASLLTKEGIPVLSFDIEEKKRLEKEIDHFAPTHFVHLAAQAGVRRSLTHPAEYQKANLDAFFAVLEVLKSRTQIPLILASSSSVYGKNKKIPFSESDPTDSPANYYAATKKGGELMARAYHETFGLKVTALRFFTVYGPFGRPDMAYYSFAKAIAEGRPIKLYNEGKMRRDFTYIDDIISGTISAIDHSFADEVFNLGNNKPEELMRLVSLLEEGIGKRAIIELLPMPKGEIEETYADIEKAKKLLGFSPTTSLEEGIGLFLNWAFATKTTLSL